MGGHGESKEFTQFLWENLDATARWEML